MKKLLALLLVALMVLGSVSILASCSGGTRTTETTTEKVQETTPPATGTDTGTGTGTGTTDTTTGTTDTTTGTTEVGNPENDPTFAPGVNGVDISSWITNIKDGVKDGDTATFTTRWGSWAVGELTANLFFEIIFVIDKNVIDTGSSSEVAFASDLFDTLDGSVWVVRIEGYNYYVVASKVTLVPYYSTSADEDVNEAGKTAICIAFESGTTNANPKFVPVDGVTYEIELACAMYQNQVADAKLLVFDKLEDGDQWAYAKIKATGSADCGKDSDGVVTKQMAWMYAQPHAFEDHHHLTTGTGDNQKGNDDHKGEDLGLTLVIKGIPEEYFGIVSGSPSQFRFVFKIKNLTAGDTGYTTYYALPLTDDSGELRTPAFFLGTSYMRIEIIPKAILDDINSHMNTSTDPAEFIDLWGAYKPWEVAKAAGVSARGEGGEYFYPKYGDKYLIMTEIWDTEQESELQYIFSPLELVANYPVVFGKDVARYNDLQANPTLHQYKGKLEVLKTERTDPSGAFQPAPGFHGSGKEDAYYMFDNNYKTKMCAGASNLNKNDSIIFTIATAEPVTMRGFSMVTGNDNAGYPGRDATSFTLSACATENGTYVVLAEEVVQREYNKNWEETYFIIDGSKSGSYQYYKLSLNQVKASTNQYAEFWIWVL